ncbi:protein of unknown function [Agrobacterium pusense]|uniref:Uncharacterized protein n=1 Tax=Agrobacterium pusense TaxID=648995 RepID=U4PWD4_9HYPH|nr:protein of unknown function [Agrobacterium pusense]
MVAAPRLLLREATFWIKDARNDVAGVFFYGCKERALLGPLTFSHPMLVRGTQSTHARGGSALSAQVPGLAGSL